MLTSFTIISSNILFFILLAYGIYIYNINVENVKIKNNDLKRYGILLPIIYIFLIIFSYKFVIVPMIVNNKFLELQYYYHFVGKYKQCEEYNTDGIDEERLKYFYNFCTKLNNLNDKNKERAISKVFYNELEYILNLDSYGGYNFVKNVEGSTRILKNINYNYWNDYFFLTILAFQREIRNRPFLLGLKYAYAKYLFSLGLNEDAKKEMKKIFDNGMSVTKPTFLKLYADILKANGEDKGAKEYEEKFLYEVNKRLEK